MDALERSSQFVSKKQFSEAAMVLRQAIHSGDDHLEVLYGTLSSVHSIEGRPDKQLSVLEEGLAVLPDDAGLKIQLANALLVQGNDPDRIRSLLASANIPRGDPWEKLAQEIATHLDRRNASR